MVTDLFQKISKKEQLLNFIRDKGKVKTSQVIRWGSENFCNRAERTARDLATEGKIRRMSDEDKNIYYPGSKEDIWEIIQ